MSRLSCNSLLSEPSVLLKWRKNLHAFGTQPWSVAEYGDTFTCSLVAVIALSRAVSLGLVEGKSNQMGSE